MKSNIMRMHYQQIAIEIFSKKMKTVPFVSKVEICRQKNENEISNTHIKVHYSDSKLIQDFYLYITSNGEKRFAIRYVNNLAIEKVKSGACYIFMAPYISEETAKLLSEQGQSFMDFCGNCYILNRRMIIVDNGKPNLYKDNREKRFYFSKSSSAASTILRTMINEPEKFWKVKELSEKSRKAIGTVSNVKSFLEDKDYIYYDKKSFALKNIRNLLYEWSKDYHKTESLIKQYYSLDKLSIIEKNISDWSILNNKKAMLTSFSAAARYMPTVRYNKVDVYLSSENLTNFAKDLELEEVTTGGNVIITIPHDNTPLLFNQIINNTPVVSAAQTIIDLLGKPNRGEEAAEAIISKLYRDIEG